MSTKSSPWFLAGLGLLALALCFSGYFLRGQAAPQANQKGLNKLYFGIEACTQCHTQPGQQGAILCRCNEGLIWEKEDKHKDAFVVLRGDRATRMGKLLGIADVTKERQCVSCHGVFIEDPKLRHRTFKEEDGVSCAICHGTYREWVALHGDVLERDNWRGYPRKVKQDKFGMTDLWDPAERTRLCASCHVGNTAEGKVVTHAMYAAGHPPLPGFEVATFGDAMPRHWQTLSEKDEKVKALLQFDGTTLEQTQLVAESGVATFREAMRLLATQAGRCAEEADPGQRVLDLAQFDCYACHHELRSPSWRQKRGYVGRPGRLQMRPWSTALVHTGIRHAAGADVAVGKKEKAVFQAALHDLYKAFDARPFGDCKQVAGAADRLVQWCDGLLKQMRQNKYDRPAALRLLRELSATQEVLDYDGARQVAWAFRQIYSELTPKPSEKALVPAVLVKLDAELNLRLPAGQKYKIEDELDKNLKRLSTYEPDAFQVLLAELRKALAAEFP